MKLFYEKVDGKGVANCSLDLPIDNVGVGDDGRERIDGHRRAVLVTHDCQTRRTRGSIDWQTQRPDSGLVFAFEVLLSLRFSYSASPRVL